MRIPTGIDISDGPNQFPDVNISLQYRVGPTVDDRKSMIILWSSCFGFCTFLTFLCHRIVTTSYLYIIIYYSRLPFGPFSCHGWVGISAQKGRFMLLSVGCFFCHLRYAVLSYLIKSRKEGLFRRSFFTGGRSYFTRSYKVARETECLILESEKFHYYLN
jgi:hypothetical protein